ncbi:hypothetical protein ACJW30_11G024500 [Castanea mollissima]
MSVIREAALSSLFGVLFDKLTSYYLLKIFQQEQVHADLNKWKIMLMKIHAVLDDAEEKWETSRLVNIWLDDLEDLAYDAEDILDEFTTEALQRELNPKPNKSKVRKIIDACVGSNRSFITLMRSKIANIDSRLQRIMKDKNDLELRENTGGKTTTTRSRVPTTSLVNERHTYGREEDKKAIIKLLLSSEFSDAQLSVIPIVGMGGLGKTTLAQLVYNAEDMTRYFDLKAWAFVSEDFDIVRVTKAILQSVTSKHCDASDLNLIQVKLKEKLYNKKFLLILDDVWNEDNDDWTKLCCPFEFGAPESTIIVTTRNYGVSTTVGTTPAYELKELSSNACWHLFIQHALGAKKLIAHPKLEEIRWEILLRCKGSPLATKVLGGVLRTKHNHDEWENVTQSKIWDIPRETNSTIPVLKLSYQYLPSHLKRCVAYCSLFPKDYEFEENKLVLLWMAEGLVQETERNKSMEDLGSEYFCDLLRRSFFQQSSNNGSLFIMHDLISDLVEWATRGLCYRMEDTLGNNKQPEISTKNVLDVEDARRANLNGKKNLDALVIKWGSPHDHLQDARVAIDILDMLRPWTTVKELSIDGYIGEKFPTWLGDPSFSNIVDLRIVTCEKCMSLPAIGHLFSLKFLVIMSMAKVRSIGQEFYGEGHFKPFQFLEKLHFVNMQEWQDWIPYGVEYEEFPCLRELIISQCPKLQGKLPRHLPFLEKFSISNCEQLVVSIPSCPMLHELEIVGCKGVLTKNMDDLFLLKSIIFSIPGLKSLTKEFMKGLAKVENLKINDCNELTSLWQDSLTSLDRLEIWLCPSLINISLASTSKSFPKEEDGKMMMLLPTSLTSLWILNFPNIVLLSSKAFQNLSALEDLWISNCPKLASLPEKGLPPSLLQLYIYDCPVLKQRCKKDKEGEWFKINNIPCVEIDYRSIYEMEEEEQQ